jgi:hypothetical protein
MLEAANCANDFCAYAIPRCWKPDSFRRIISDGINSSGVYGFTVVENDGFQVDPTVYQVLLFGLQPKLIKSMN